MKREYKLIMLLILVISIVALVLTSSYALFSFEEKGKIENKLVTGVYSSCSYEDGTIWNFDYTGGEQTFTVPCDGEYKIEAWGAQNGAYTSGNINFDKDVAIFAYVGGAGNSNESSSTAGGWNGGGSTSLSTTNVHGTSGAGSTDIRLVDGNWNNFESLKSRIMVASGGGTAPGGGLYGNVGTVFENYSANIGTQTNGGATPIKHSCGLTNGTAGGFGYGGNGGGSSGFSKVGGGCGGGSGYYGGSGTSGICNGNLAAASGSSFISGHDGCDAIKKESTSSNIIHTGQSKHYSGYIFKNTIMIDGSGYSWTTVKGEQTGMPSHDNLTTIMEHTGNGYARITLVKADKPIKKYKEAILNGTDPVLKDNLVPITIAEDGTVTKADISKEWYSYANKEWANAVILKDETKIYNDGDTIPEDNIESYFVWIPRYKYQIFDEGNYTGLTSTQNKVQTINVVFENKDTTPSNGTIKGDWLTHPAFTSFDSNGFWVGKFETGYDGATSTTAAQVNSVNTSKIIIKPNVYSWRNITVGNAFKNSYDYQRDLDSHMMKNTEWGAVAYLHHSIYGSETSVRVNNNGALITGYAATVEPTKVFSPSSIDGDRYESTSLGNDGTYTVNYLNSNSGVASTTGNKTGIYDMSGGAWEYVMGYTTSSSTIGGTSEITSIYSDFFTNSIYTKYWDKYTSNSQTQYNNRILGDATGELGPFKNSDDLDGGARPKSSWYKNYSNFAYSSNPWFIRGSTWNGGTISGAFAFSRDFGGAHIYNSFRIVMTP